MRNRHSIIDQIRRDDPEYQPLPEAYRKDAMFRFAENYIHADGWHGPFSPRDLFREAGPRERGLTLSEAKTILRWTDPRDAALSILKDAADSIDDYRHEDYMTCDEADCAACESGEGHLCEDWRIDSRDIVKDRFAYVFEIYGAGII